MPSSSFEDNGCDRALMRDYEQELEIKVRAMSPKERSVFKEYLIKIQAGSLPDNEFVTLVQLSQDAARELLTQREDPPSMAEKLLYLALSKQDRVALPGDLEEEFRTLLSKFGRRYARVWYWKQVLGSVRPLARRLVFRIATCAGVWKAIEVALRKIGF